MAKKKVELKLRLDNVRTSFCKIFEAEAVKKGDKPAYSCHFIFEEKDPQVKTVRQALRKIAHAKWGKEAGDRVLKQMMRNDRVCLHNGNDKLDGDEKIMEGYADRYYISSRSYVRPTAIHRDRSPLTEEDGIIFSGCYVNCYISLWAQTGQYGKRINAQLQGVQFVKTGESFGGGKAADPDVFDTLADEFSDDDDDFTDFDNDDFENADDLVDDFDDDIAF